MADDRLVVVEDFGASSEAAGGWSHRRAIVQVVPGADGRCLVLKLRSRDATRLAATLTGCNALSMSPGEGGVLVTAWRDAECLGPITTLPRRDADIEALAISKGGSRRAHFWAHEVVAAFPVTLRVPLPTANRHEAESDAAETLLRYVHPLHVQAMPPRIAREVLEIASVVWRGVVLAELHDDSSVLEAACRSAEDRGAPVALVEWLVGRKAHRFADDRRLFVVREVTGTADGMVPVVAASRPELVSS